MTISLSSVRYALIDGSPARGNAYPPKNIMFHVSKNAWISALAVLLLLYFWEEHGITVMGYMLVQFAFVLFGVWIHNQRILWAAVGQIVGSSLILLASGAVGVTLTQAALIVALCFFKASILAVVLPKD